MADYRAKNRNTKAGDLARVRAAARFSTPAPKAPVYAMGGARGGMPVSAQGNISKFIESQVEAMVRDTAESVGQVANEGLSNPIISPVGSLLPKDFLSKQVGKINANAGESMRGKVTATDLVNVASLLPVPAGTVARVGGAVVRGAAANLIPEGGRLAVAGVGELGGALARTGIPSGRDALRYTPQAVAVGLRGGNVEYATATSMGNPRTMTTNATPRSNISQDLKKYNDTTTQRFKEAGKPPPPRLKMVQYKKMRDEAIAANPDYQIKKLTEETEFLKKHGGDPKDLKADDLTFKDNWTVAHDFKKGLSGDPKHIISGEANRLEYEALTKDPSLKSYREVLGWAIKNKPQYKNYISVDDLAKDLGMLHVIDL